MQGRSLATTLAVLITLALPAAASAATFTVNDGGDAPDATIDGSCATAGAVCTLRAAIAESNATAAVRDAIRFAVGVTTVTTATSLSITAPVDLDGGDGVPELVGSETAGLVLAGTAGAATQETSTRIEQLELSGFSDGVEVHADTAQLAALEIHGSVDDAVVIAADAEDVFVVGGLLDDNAGDGLELAGTDATIGGLPSQTNTIVRNDGAGVRVLGGASGTVSDNLIGLTALVAAGNGTGVALGSDLTQVFANVISGNTGDGIAVTACGDVLGNVIGLAPDGITARGNGGDGVEVQAATCQVGGTLLGNGNTISANAGNGVLVTGDGAVIQGNRIGMATAGLTLRGNAGNGISATGDSVLVGGDTAAGAANTIAGNGLDGVRLTGSDVATVAGNSIHDNTGRGIAVSGTTDDEATIGFPVAGLNTISANGGAGVAVTGDADARIRDDSITGNGGLGIDLGDNGVTFNDPLDADTGPNELQNFPVLASVRRQGGLRVRGSIAVPASGLVQIDVYDSTDCVGGIGEGAVKLGSFNLVVASAGNAPIDSTIAGDVPAGTDVTATATRDSRTSEFSPCAVVQEATSELSFSPSTATVDETAGSVLLNVQRAGPPVGTTTVQYSTANGSATAGTDFTATSGTLTFLPGDTGETIEVPILDDGAPEGDQTFTVSLFLPTNGEISPPSTATVTIQSDEALFVVNDGGDAPDASINGTCATAGAVCTLRAAVQEANADADFDAVVVADTVTRIELGAGFPAIVEPLGFSGAITGGRVIIDGNDVAGLAVTGAGTATQTQLTDVVVVDAGLVVTGSDVLLQDADVSGAAGAGVTFGAGATGAIGGAVGHGNRIFGNGQQGVLLAGAGGVNVSHNRIGIDGANGGDGVATNDASGQVFENVISGNGSAGLRLSACPDAVTGNRIGTQADGTGSVPNAGAGVVIAAAGCQVGGSQSDDPNTISGNTGPGIDVQAAGAVVFGNSIHGNDAEGVRAAGPAARLQGNSITANGALGIDDGPAGVSPGAPVLTSVVRESGTLHVTGSLAAAASGQYDLEFFANAQCDQSGFGEGATPLGIKSIATASPGTVAIDLVVPADAPAGSVVTATQTTAGQTSEFSNCATAQDAGGTTPPPGGTTPPPGGTTPPPGGTQADPQSTITSPRGTVKARRLKRIRGTAQDAARVHVAVIRVKGRKCFALTRRGTFARRTGPRRCSPRAFFRANGTATWSFRLKRRFPPGRYRIYSRATAADGSRESPPARVRVRVRR